MAVITRCVQYAGSSADLVQLYSQLEKWKMVVMFTVFLWVAAEGGSHGTPLPTAAQCQVLKVPFEEAWWHCLAWPGHTSGYKGKQDLISKA